MNTEKFSKINRLLQFQPAGAVFTSSWMSENGYSLELQRQYRKSNWFESIGTGAMKRVGEHVSLEGALYSLQEQLGLRVHIGGISALAMQGKAHYLALGEQRTYLYCPTKTSLPKWFLAYDGWKDKFVVSRTDFLPATIGLTAFQQTGYSIRISAPARAIMECLYEAHSEPSLIECFEIMEGLNNLRPQLIQDLLEQCNSVKVKRLFLFMAERAGHRWFGHLHVERINLGQGKRSIVANGGYDAKYGITLPKALLKDEGAL